jgi:PAS domain S-box-containing protein
LLSIGAVLGFVPEDVPNCFVPCRIAAVLLITASLLIVVRQLGNISKGATRLVVISACLAILTQTLTVCEVIPSLDGVPVLGKGGFLRDPVWHTAYPLAVTLLLAGFFFAALEAQTARGDLAREQPRLSRELAGRKQAEKVLEESEKRYRLLADNVTDVICTLDMGLRFTYLSPSVVPMLGYSLEEALSTSLDRILAPASFSAVKKALAEELLVEEEEYADPNRSRTLELEFLRKDGSTVWTEVNATFLREPNGRITDILAVVRDITGRKSVENSLRESEEKYRELVENVNDVIYAADTNGLVTYVSPALESLIGYSPNEVLGRSFGEFIYGEDLGRAAEGFQEVLAGVLKQREYRLVSKSGEIRCVLTSSKPILEGGRVVGLRGMLADITERKLAGEAVRESEEKYRHLFEQLNDAAMVADTETGVILDANEQAELLLGRTRDEIIGMHQSALHPPDRSEYYRELFTAHVAKGRATEFDGEVLRKDGSTVPVMMSAATLTLGGRRLIVGLFRDITERKQAERMLQESERRALALLNAPTDRVALIDRDGLLLALNGQMAESLGATADELVGACVWDLVPSDLADSRKEQVDEVFRSGQPLRVEDERAGVVYDNNLYPVIGPEGDVSAVAVYARDITELKRAEDALRRSRDELETQVEERTADLMGANEELLAEIAERRRAEKALRESEEKYRLLVENAGYPITLLDRDGTVLFINPEGAENLGGAHRGFIGKSIYDLLPDMAGVLIERHQQMLRSGVGGIFEDKFELPSGKQWFLSNIQPVKDSRGETYAILVISHDITDRRLAQEALRQSEARYRTLVETSPDAVVLSDVHGKILWTNQRAALMYGFESVEEMLSQRDNVFDFMSRDDRARAIEEGKRVLRKGRQTNLAYQSLRRDGTCFPADVSVSVVEEADGKVGALLMIIRDVTERTRAEEALRESEQRYRSVLQDQTELICRWLPGGELTFVNDAYCRYFHKKPEELIGHSFVPLILEEDRERVTELISLLGPDNPIEVHEQRVLAPDGEVRWQQWTNRVILDDKGRTIEFQSVGRDVTERKRAEEQIKAALEEKELLLKEIQHRVKNNLQVISSLFDLQSRYSADHEVLDMLRESRNRVKSIALIHEKLYQAQDLTRIDFAEYVRTLSVHLFRSYGVGHELVKLKTRFDDFTLAVDTAIPCALIVNELVSNCLKHAFPSGRRGEVRVELSADNGECTVVVSDDGIGFPKEIDFGNPGSLGLRLVRTLADQLQGTIDLDRNGGTTFSVRFRAS